MAEENDMIRLGCGKLNTGMIEGRALCLMLSVMVLPRVRGRGDGSD